MRARAMVQRELQTAMGLAIDAGEAGVDIAEQEAKAVVATLRWVMGDKEELPTDRILADMPSVPVDPSDYPRAQ